MIIKISEILVDHANNVSRDAFNAEACEELAACIEANGMIQPVLVRPIDHEHYLYELVVGYRRIVACGTILGHTEIDCSVRSLTDEQAKLLNIKENLEREGLSFWEECHMLKRAFDPELSDLQIAKLVSKSRGWVRNRWPLWKMPDDVIAHVEAGYLSAADVNTLISKTTEEQSVTAARIVKGKEEGFTTQELAEKYSGRKAIRTKKVIQQMMTSLMEQDKLKEMHVLRWALGEIDETLLWVMIAD